MSLPPHDDDPLIGVTEMARRAEVARSTMSTYRSQGRLPEPDDTSVPDRPRWRLSTFTKWMESRPGQGARSDLRHVIPIPMSRYTGPMLRPGGVDGDGPWEVVVRRAGMTPAVRMLEVGHVRDGTVAALLGLDPGAELIRRRRVMLADDVPVELHEAWLPVDLFAGTPFDHPKVVVGGTYAMFTQLGHPPYTASEAVTVRAATQDEAGELRLPQRIPVVCVERVTRGADRRVLEVLRVTAAGNRVVYRYDDMPLI